MLLRSEYSGACDSMNIVRVDFILYSININIGVCSLNEEDDPVQYACFAFSAAFLNNSSLE